MSRFHVGCLLWVIVQWEVASESDSDIINYYGHLQLSLQSLKAKRHMV